jgi:hypothetical protein
MISSNKERNPYWHGPDDTSYIIHHPKVLKTHNLRSPVNANKKHLTFSSNRNDARLRTMENS